MMIPKSKQYDANRERYGHGVNYPCVVCGRPVSNPKYMVECVNGGVSECVMPETADTSDPGYMGFFPVGPDCLKKHPELKPFVVIVKESKS